MHEEEVMRELEPGMFVAGQISPEQASTSGMALIVNNRPDGEEPGQPTSAEVEAAARAAGIDYRHIPVAGGFSEPQVTEMAAALAGADGPVLAFCKSGTRSTFLWALARSRQAEDGAALFRKAAAAGYDLAPLRHIIGH
jgi:uncharacterized protein (TIGR01244 family)